MTSNKEEVVLNAPVTGSTTDVDNLYVGKRIVINGHICRVFAYVQTGGSLFMLNSASSGIGTPNNSTSYTVYAYKVFKPECQCDDCDRWRTILRYCNSVDTPII